MLLHNDKMAAATPDWQRAFRDAILQPDAPPPIDISGQSAAQRIKRFNVYRNNVHASLAAAIAARYPVINRLVGDEFFRAMALVFIDRRPPASPVIAEYGAEFPDFLVNFEPVADFPYLPDVARLEWARNVAYHAADKAGESIDALGKIPPENLPRVGVEFHPAAALLGSPYPIVSIWRTNTHDENVRPIGSDLGAEFALITRPHLDVLITPLSAASAAFVEKLQHGSILGDAASATTDAFPALDLPATLAALFSAGAVSRIAIVGDDIKRDAL